MRRLLAFLLLLCASPALAQTDYAARLAEGDVTLRDFRFRSGETLAELRIHYATLGTPHRDARGNIDNAVMVLHGTGGSGRQFLQPQFADELGVTRLRLLMGTSMGCMHAFVWAQAHPDFARAIMPLACFPIEIAGHNRMWRQMAVEGIRNDPAWANGNYTSQPVQGLRTAVSILQIAGFAPRYLQRQYPTREAAETYIVERVERDIAARDANDLIYQLEASRNYDPRPNLERIRSPIMWINSEDDFINPAGNEAVTILDPRLPTVHYVLTPQSAETRGHGTHTWARFWTQWVVELLQRTED